METKKLFYHDDKLGQTFEEGDGIIIHNRKVDNIGTLLGALIRLVTRSYWNHAATVINWQGELWIYEAVGTGVYPTRPLKEWLDQCYGGYRDFRVLNLPEMYLGHEAWKMRLREVQGSRYDYLSVLIFHPLSIFLKIVTEKDRYLGHKSGRAKKNWFCSELLGYLRQLPDWWKLTPKMLALEYETKFGYTHGTT